MAEPTSPATDLPRILIVDDSRIVRATIIKHVRGRFAVREESDGEAGWAALLADPTLQMVISDLSMPKLDGYGLVERIRTSNVPRIRELPVVMVSGDEDEASRKRAKSLGANDFITKGIGTAELLARLETLVKLSQTHEALAQSRAEAAIDPASGLMTPPLLLRQAEQALAYALRHGSLVNVMVIGFDVAAGEQVAMVTTQFAKILAGRVRKEDSLARWADSELAILVPGINDSQVRAFAERLRDAVARSAIQIDGRAVRSTVSIGIARCPDDGATDADAFLILAAARMKRAREAGGNQIVAAEKEAEAFAGEGIDAVLAAIAAGRVDALRPRLGHIGLRLLPLLRLLDKEFGLQQPIEELARRLSSGGPQ